MPKVKLPLMFVEIKGKMDDMVLKLSPQGGLIIAKCPWDVALSDHLHGNDLLA